MNMNASKKPEHQSAADREQGVRVTVRELAGLRSEAARLAAGGSLLASMLTGAHHSLLRGRGLEFDETRAYQAGDDYRHLDWRVTARTGRLHTKLFREERERSLYLLLDAAPSMHFGSRNVFKWVNAARAAAVAAWLATAKGDRVGGLVFGAGSRLLVRHPTAGEVGALRLFQLWQGIQTASGERGHERAGLYEALTRLRRLARPGSLVLLFSDFYDLAPGCEAHLAHLGRHTEMVSLLVYDPLEEALPPPGHYPFSDGKRLVTIDTSDRALRRRYQERFTGHREAIAALCRRHAIRFLTLGTHQSHLACFREGE